MLKKVTFLPVHHGAPRHGPAPGKAPGDDKTGGVPVLTRPELPGQLFLRGYVEEPVERRMQVEAFSSIRLSVAM